MVIYEVNLNVQNEIFVDYYRWLIDHVKKILAFPGFESAKIAIGKDENNIGYKLITVWYSLLDEMSLSDYLNSNAPGIRQDGINKFGNKFTATRRVFIDNQTIYTNV